MSDRKSGQRSRRSRFDDDGRNRSRSRSPQNRDEDPKKEKIGSTSKTKTTIGIQMKLEAKPSVNKPKLTVATVFNQESDEETEEMPPEARMRMRNIGRETPTSSGPNSFGKTKQGFSDSKKVFEKNLKAAIDKSAPTK